MMKTEFMAEDVFRPTSFPKYTYIDRRFSNGNTYEAKLKKALRSSGRLISITGASKTGKTVLCHKVVEQERIIDLSGAQIQSKEDFWNQIAEKIHFPLEIQMTTIEQNKLGVSISAGGKGKIPFLASAQASGQISADNSTGKNIAVKEVRSSNAMINYMIINNKVLVIDDFHYINDELQLYIARILKTALFNGLKAILLSLPHRADDAIRHNPDLIGRTSFIEIEAWTVEELQEIAVRGFKLLHLNIDEDCSYLLARESITSPQLMQQNCFNLAYGMQENNINEVSKSLVEQCFRETVADYTHYDEILAKILKGPKQGRNKRKHYLLKTGKNADIYLLLLIAVSEDPPILSFRLEDIKSRFSALLDDIEKLPRQLSIANAVANMEKIIRDAVSQLDTVEWKNQCLYILDPFLLFYLRWSNNWKNF